MYSTQPHFSTITFRSLSVCLYLAYCRLLQELSYRKQIARQLRTQYVEGNSNTKHANYANYVAFVCRCRRYTDAAYDSDNQLPSEPAGDRSTTTTDNDDRQPPSPRTTTPTTALGDMSGAERERVYCSPSDISQLSTTSSMLRHQNQQLFSRWLNHVPPTTFTNGQTSHS